MFRRVTSFILLSLFPVLLLAQDSTTKQIDRQKIKDKTIKGTLDGVNLTPKATNNNRQLVFPNSITNEFSNNPWLKSKPLQKRSSDYTGLPKGNPWAPIGVNQPYIGNQDIPGRQTESNPYTDAKPNNLPSQGINNPYRINPYNVPYQTQSSPFGNTMNQPFNNGGFSMPFGDNFFPSNNFWPGVNNGNGSLPFMPW